MKARCSSQVRANADAMNLAMGGDVPGPAVAAPLGYRAAWPDRSRRDSPKITGGTARFTTSRMAKLD
jgi:hypothetical protein